MAFDPISAGISALGFGLSMFEGAARDRQAARELDNQRKQAIRNHRNAVYERTQQNLLIDFRNVQIEKNFGTKVELAKQQIGFNQSAANRAIQGEQQRLNQVFSQAAFQRANMMKSLLQAQGLAAAAGGNRGRSFDRAAAKANLGTFGRDQALLVEMLGGERAASRSRTEDVFNQMTSANFASYSQVAIPDSLQMNLPGVQRQAMPTSSYRPNMALRIGTSLLQGVNSYNSMAPDNMGLNAKNPSFGLT